MCIVYLMNTIDVFVRCNIYFSRFQFVDIIRRCLEITTNYELILSEDDLDLLFRYVELLKIFEIFTVYVQAKNYPTVNMVILFRSEISDR